jgi:hypothetical protein
MDILPVKMRRSISLLKSYEPPICGGYIYPPSFAKRVQKVLKTNKTSRKKRAKREKERHQERTKWRGRRVYRRLGRVLWRAETVVGSFCGGQINDSHGQLY